MTTVPIDRNVLSSILTPQERRVYILEEVREIQSPLHRFLTGTAIGHSPSDEELERHWIHTGAHEVWPQTFAERHPEVLERI